MPAKWHKYSYSAQRQERRSALIILIFVLVFAAVFWVVHSFLFTMYSMESATMEPSLSHGERIIATPLYGPTANGSPRLPFLSVPIRGDLVLVEPEYKVNSGLFKAAADSIISFATLQQIQPFANSLSLVSKPVIRRIVGMPGDTIYLEKSVLHIKSPDSAHYLTEFEIIDGNYDINVDILPQGWSSDLPFADSTEELVLGPNEYFVLCDNRQTASDSRIWGPVSGSRITSKVLFRYWPFSRIGLLR